MRCWHPCWGAMLLLNLDRGCRFAQPPANCCDPCRGRITITVSSVCSCSFAESLFRRLRVKRLVKLHDDVAVPFKMGHEAESPVGHRLGELDAARFEIGDRLVDFVAIE